MELEYMDNTKNDHYYLDKIKTDIAFIVAHMKDVNASSYTIITAHKEKR